MMQAYANARCAIQAKVELHGFAVKQMVILLQADITERYRYCGTQISIFTG
jgi:hypothetical protein